MDVPHLTTSLIALIYAQDVAAGGIGKTGLVFNSPGLVCYYIRNKGALGVGVSLVNMTLGTWVSGGFKEIDAVNLPGMYAFGVPDAATAVAADGSTAVAIMFTGIPGVSVMPLRLDIVRYAEQGAGAITWTYTLTSTVDGSPIANADVWVTTDIAGLNTIAAGRTDAFGVVTFYLDAGTVYVWRQKSGWSFVNPDTEVVV